MGLRGISKLTECRDGNRYYGTDCMAHRFKHSSLPTQALFTSRRPWGVSLPCITMNRSCKTTSMLGLGSLACKSRPLNASFFFTGLRSCPLLLFLPLHAISFCRYSTFFSCSTLNVVGYVFQTGVDALSRQPGTNSDPLTVSTGMLQVRWPRE